MKLVECNGKTLTVRDVGDVLLTLRAGAIPIKFNGHKVMDDNAARKLIRELLDTGFYAKE